MTIEDVKARLETIRRLAEAHDDASAHAREDKLHIVVLEEIASGNVTAEQAAALAKESLVSRTISFNRWHE